MPKNIIDTSKEPKIVTTIYALKEYNEQVEPGSGCYNVRIIQCDTKKYLLDAYCQALNEALGNQWGLKTNYVVEELKTIEVESLPF